MNVSNASTASRSVMLSKVDRRCECACSVIVRPDASGNRTTSPCGTTPIYLARSSGGRRSISTRSPTCNPAAAVTASTLLMVPCGSTFNPKAEYGCNGNMRSGPTISIAIAVKVRMNAVLTIRVMRGPFSTSGSRLPARQPMGGHHTWFTQLRYCEMRSNRETTPF